MGGGLLIGGRGGFQGKPLSVPSPPHMKGIRSAPFFSLPNHHADHFSVQPDQPKNTRWFVREFLNTSRVDRERGVGTQQSAKAPFVYDDAGERKEGDTEGERGRAGRVLSQ